MSNKSGELFKFYILVVLYRRAWNESSSVLSIIDKFSSDESLIHAKLVIWNNSPGFSPRLNHPSVIWKEAENSALSFVYNSFSSLAFESDADAIMISDDDTNYSTYEFSENLKIVREHVTGVKEIPGAECFLPRIRSGGIVISPGRRFLFKGYLVPLMQPGVVPAKNLLAINSGTIITKKCYMKMRPLYDARLKFYGTDTGFFVRYEDFFSKVFLFDSLIEHSLSEHSQESVERALFRFGDNLYAMKVIFASKSGFFKISMMLYHFILKFKMFIKFRDVRFIKL